MKHVDEFVKLFKELDYSIYNSKKFNHFIDISFAFFRMPFIPDGRQLYLEAFNKVRTEDQPIYSKLFGIMIDAMTEEHQDFLGNVFMQMDMGNEYTGQFFTAYSVCKLVASLNLPGPDQLKKNGYITLNEPACGAGAMIIAFAEQMIKAKLNPATQLFVVAQDIDYLVARMCYIQLSAYDIPAKVIVGDTLRVEEREYWLTPAIYLHDWNSRIAIRKLLDILKTSSTPEPAIQDLPVIEPINSSAQYPVYTQLSLFKD